jgi:2-keto-4-pentenoate hydratase/2-oxohepta-3-ene-1,7-dioic acid hydratase in catechol pathway
VAKENKGVPVKFGRLGEAGHEFPVVFVDGQTAISVADIIPDWSRDTLMAGAIDAISDADLTTRPRLTVADYRIAPPLQRPGKIIAIGLNYRLHAEETGAAIPTEPVVFTKSPDCVVGPFDQIKIPPGSTRTDYEVELAIVIGRHLSYAVNEADALSAVAGYTISQDISEREWQKDRGGTWDKGKSFPTFNPMGPWVDTQLPHPQNLEVSTTVNGEVRQHSTTADMIFPLPYLVYYVSQCMELFPGDVINTGTPSGVAMGMATDGYLKAGDQVDSYIEHLGRMRNTCINTVI